MIMEPMFKKVGTNYIIYCNVYYLFLFFRILPVSGLLLFYKLGLLFASLLIFKIT